MDQINLTEPISLDGGSWVGVTYKLEKPSRPKKERDQNAGLIWFPQGIGQIWF